MTNLDLSIPCPLCARPAAESFHRNDFSGARHFDCAVCRLVFLDPQQRLSAQAERARYLLHENAVTDPGYRVFLRPALEAVRGRLMAPAAGLDFGAGPGPALATMLAEEGFTTALYDPFFHPSPEALERTYDFVVCTEAAEHFHSPALEFARMRRCLRKGGILVIMTQMVPSADFGSWHYHRDPTHVCFYRPETFAWIAREVGFERVEIPSASLAVLEV